MNENDPHDMLVKSYLAYFKANEKFEERNSVRTHALSRKLLRDIRKYAKLRMEEIHLKHKTKKEADGN